jgi:hypothetical protein
MLQKVVSIVTSINSRVSKSLAVVHMLTFLQPGLLGLAKLAEDVPCKEKRDGYKQTAFKMLPGEWGHK